VSSSGHNQPELVAQAEALAARWGLPYFARPYKAPLERLIGSVAEALLVVGGDGLSLWDSAGVLRFTPGMARLRIKQLDAGIREDALVRLGELAPADHVLDCTLGLAGDALVAAHAVGPSGRVVGVESSLPLAVLIAEAKLPGIEVVHGEALAHLRALPDRSFDVVLFDPMFGRPGKSAERFEVLRRFANHGELTPEALEEAKRVARRCVLVKGSRYSQDFKKLGLVSATSSRSRKILWARVPSAHPARL
jgi:16S rRNA (guanine1516-N2)-methyltransferase